MEQVVAFVLELDRLKAVTRKVKPLGQDRYENSAEHSWHLAMLALSLAPHAEPGTDMDRVIRMLLVHDIGEIDTGDTLFFIEAGRQDRKVAEEQAVARILGLLPDGQGAPLLDLWREFEAGTSREARFAQAMDRAAPVLLNLASDGQSWRENGVRYEQVVARVGPPIAAGCPALWNHIAGRLDAARDAGWFGIAYTASQ
ncbi:HD family hydrolase [Niveispirillum sp.]|uniref:HD domain-containing protein n=1 Tax=Niveispirillum sp. TaxID=1917217 RepID=UPI001B57AF6F|nr:HD domain-containing protein [Niveispirillum sp.]MBP7339221.1 HD domain-containing protein [Niveispirillum sp.]